MVRSPPPGPAEHGARTPSRLNRITKASLSSAPPCCYEPRLSSYILPVVSWSHLVIAVIALRRVGDAVRSVRKAVRRHPGAPHAGPPPFPRAGGAGPGGRGAGHGRDRDPPRPAGGAPAGHADRAGLSQDLS